MIAALIKGNVSSSSDDGSVSASSNTPTNPSGSDYSVVLVNSMLKFNSADGMLNFLGALDTTIAHWDTNLDTELQGLMSEKNIAGDPTKNAFDSAMGFSSLRKKYEMAFYDNNNYKTSLPFEIKEEDTRTVLNANHEVQIGTTIYKFMGYNVIAEILNEDYTTLQFLRDHPGLINNSPNLKLKNATSGLILPETTPAGPQGECTASASYYLVKDFQNDYRQVYLQIFPKAEKDGNTAYCGWYYTVTWGDGFSTPAPPYNVDPILRHTYNVNLSAGQCQSFTINISVQAITCSIRECQNVVGTVPPISVNICNVVVGCGQNTSSVPSPPTYFTFGGINYRIIGEVGAQHATSLWPRRNMIYSRTFWQKQRGSNWYPTSNKKVHLTARVYGPVYKNNCTTVSERDRSTTKRNQVHVEVNDVINEKFGYTRIDPNTLKSDHYVFIDIGGGYTASIIGLKLQ